MTHSYVCRNCKKIATFESDWTRQELVEARSTTRKVCTVESPACKTENRVEVEE